MKRTTNHAKHRQRTIYFNDARHYYLFVHEPPMSREVAGSPVDEIAGTGVDTFVYGVSRDDGLFYPSKVGRRFGAGQPLAMSAYWRVWHNMQSLMDSGLDPLTVLIDRAHERQMEFIASLRMGAFPGAGDGVSPREGGRGMADEGVREHQFKVLQELLCDYPTDGIELDFSAAPMGTDWWVPADERAEHATLMTDFLRRVRDMAHNRDGTAAVVGARIYPTQELNEAAGLQVETWLQEGLIDYVVPLVYGFMILDPDMPIDWLVAAAAATPVSVYAMMQPYYVDESRPLNWRQYASAPMYRAAAANAWQRGVDGLYAWFMHWPPGATERAILTELAHPEQLHRQDRHYVLRRSTQVTGDTDYPAHLPLRFAPATDLGKGQQIPFTIADDPATDAHATQVTLRLAITDLTSADRFDLQLNGQSLAALPRRRSPMRDIDPYAGQWLEIDLRSQPPKRGANVLQITLLSRPEDLASDLILEDAELIVGYDTYAAADFS
ncbi:MAG: hypothetical protein O2782_01425 [bacterium]|nr:hypothetical protein [bacterium]